MGYVRVAAFREEPNAQAVAVILRDQGYHVETVGLADETSRPPAELPDAVASAHWARAFILSNCESEYFRDVVVNNFGVVIWQHRPGRFQR
jgi:thioesterase domain-containing protein